MEFIERAASPAVTFGPPLEEEGVEVRFGVPVDHDRISVQLLAVPSRSSTPVPASSPIAQQYQQPPSTPPRQAVYDLSQ